MSKKILIIDDNVDYSEAIASVLEAGNYEVGIANSSEEAIKVLEEKIPDLIILDIVMQNGAEGVILCRKFKKDPRLSKVPILMLTSITKQTGFSFNSDDPRHERYLPVDVFLEKPVAPRLLLEEVGKLISSG